MSKTYHLLIFFFVVQSSFGQITIENYNQTDVKGEKHGYWITYVDSSGCKVDSTDYDFKILTFYYHGKTTEMVDCWKVDSTYQIDFVVDSNYFSKQQLYSGKVITSVDSEYWYIKDVFKDGVLIKSVYFDSIPGYSIYEITDYTEKWNGQMGSAKIQYYSGDKLQSNAWYGSGKRGWGTYIIRDSLNDVRYPYWKDTPPLLAITLGYNILQSREIQIGAMWNIAKFSNFNMGGMFGPGLTYSYNLDADLHRFDVDFGFYSPFSIGLNTNYSFNSEDGILGFRPFIGTTFYHVQILYGYNLLKKANNEVLNVDRHYFYVRAAVPLFSFTKYVDPE